MSIRVFHLVKSLGRGGAEVLLAEGLRHADRDRFTYGYGYFLPWKDAVVPELEACGVEVTCFDASGNGGIMLRTWKVARLLRRWGAGLVHCHLPLAGVSGRIAGALAGIPVVYTEHNEWEYYHPLTRRINRLTWRWQDRVIAVSNGVADSIRRTVGNRVPVEVIPNGVDVEAFYRPGVDGCAVRRRLGIPVDAPVIGTVAVFRGQKQLHHWLQIARDLAEVRPQTRFIVVGDGPLMNDLDAYRRAADLEGLVHFPGFQEDVKPYFAAMDVYMMTSIVEGLPIALLEAMSMQLPVISTSVGGIPDVVTPESGFLVEPGVHERDPHRHMLRSGKLREVHEIDTGAFLEAAVKLVDQPALCRKMGEVARRTVEERHSMQRMARRLEDLYLRVLENKAGDAR